MPESFFKKICSPQAQMFPCEFCEIFKNTFFTENLRTTANAFNLVIFFLHSPKFEGLTSSDNLLLKSSKMLPCLAKSKIEIESYS